MISNFHNVPDIIEVEADMQQSIFISDCESCIIQIKGKVNAISINACKKIGVVIDKAISGVDVIKAQKLELQILDSVPIISIDQSDSCSLYLSKTSLETEIYTSSTTSLNVNVPDGDDLKELAAPEQFKHTIDKSLKLVSNVVEHAG
ncbi:unnamed protein product [Ambrosiozyma monospora]|uniref:Unnamed protein product n=1 Tax=Ambrosiozyma monospora TaxID=43982 RepID=A0ACB5TAE1_AMBMO|nr:unnamed protein product [Ambrosiozyma monospora]